ncbi:MAG: pH-sensitive adenylate cyclase [Marmoricola sp.]|nr:pH-sensitive adenylate cyclase [Marmoricola sp.]
MCDGFAVHSLTIPLIAALALCLVALIVVGTSLAHARQEITRLQAEAARTHRPLNTAERAVRAVVGTAARVRDQGVTGLLMSSIDDLTKWALEDRRAIAQVAAPDGTVTIFFSDIESSTAINHELGDEEWVKLLASHDKLIRACVDKQGGHIVKSQGDGFMIAFREPADAIRAGVDIQAALTAGRSRRLRRTPIRVRIGIHTGTVITRDGDYFGSNVAMAARVGAQAGGGEILVSTATHDALGEQDEFTFKQAGKVELKGLPGSHLLWRAA